MEIRLVLASALLLVSQDIVALAEPLGLPTEEVTVYAPYIVKKSAPGPSRSPVTVVTISRHVSYHGMNLKTDEGVTLLETHVKQVAEEICSELDRRYPKSIYVPVTQDKDCAKNAAENGLLQVKAIVAAVRAS